MTIDDFLKERNMFTLEIGEDRYNSMVDEISKTIRKNNLDGTPTMLLDLLTHIVKLIEIENSLLWVVSSEL